MDDRLVYDVGAYDGSDTAHYLSLGYRVVCIEAAPNLAEQLVVRFRSHIAEGSCRVLNVAIAEEDGRLPFYLSSQPFLNSFDRSIAGRDGCRVTEVSVSTRTFASILSDYGVPYFLKIDIEGSDHVCLNALGDDLPKYVSFEVGRDSFTEILALMKRGYSRFSLIRQDTFQPVAIPFPGTVAHLGWGARQVLRMKLRAYPRLHRMLVDPAAALVSRLRPRRPWHPEVTFSSGPAPMERQNGWCRAEEFTRVWTSAVSSGMIDSTWHDVHAARD